MKKVSFVQESGYKSSGSNLWLVASRHQASKVHISNHIVYNLLGNVDVVCALDETRQRQITQHNQNASRYCRLLHHHIDVIVFLLAQGLAFRGHDESHASPNLRNFVELLDLLASYSSELRSFLDGERVIYTSHEPQNDLTECIYEEFRAEIQKGPEKSPYIAVMMDDTSDYSNVEQSVVSMRLINDGKIEEHMLGLIDASEDQTADGLTKILL